LDGTPAARNYYSTDRFEGSDGVGYFDPTNDLRIDYVMGEGHMYHLSEARFYSNTGCMWPDRLECDCDEWGWDLCRAVEAARSARFEHGERGLLRRQNALDMFRESWRRYKESERLHTVKYMALSRKA
jgi:hypothetical protein